MRDAIEIGLGFAGGVAATVIFGRKTIAEAQALVNEFRTLAAGLHAKMDRIIAAVKA